MKGWQACYKEFCSKKCYEERERCADLEYAIKMISARIRAYCVRGFSDHE